MGAVFLIHQGVKNPPGASLAAYRTIASHALPLWIGCAVGHIIQTALSLSQVPDSPIAPTSEHAQMLIGAGPLVTSMDNSLRSPFIAGQRSDSEREAPGYEFKFTTPNAAYVYHLVRPSAIDPFEPVCQATDKPVDTMPVRDASSTAAAPTEGSTPEAGSIQNAIPQFSDERRLFENRSCKHWSWLVEMLVVRESLVPHLHRLLERTARYSRSIDLVAGFLVYTARWKIAQSVLCTAPRITFFVVVGLPLCYSVRIMLPNHPLTEFNYLVYQTLAEDALRTRLTYYMEGFVLTLCEDIAEFIRVRDVPIRLPVDDRL
ncbi:hypothetical protein BDN67DRAFT_1069419 [Paxillus ammoniavirescens]|nr:hypothetical protein BDN67DRAFT_1069419 [Paxillus ammoniavirescens]